MTTPARTPAPIEQDARGIVDVPALRAVATLHRYPSGAALAGLVDRFWAVTWQVPDGQVHAQQVLTHPGANLSVGTTEAGDGLEAALHGVHRRISTRQLRGRGWTVAALTAPGGLGALVPLRAADLTDRVVPLEDVVDVGRPGLAGRVETADGEAARVDVLRSALERALARADPERVAAARATAAVAAAAERDRSLRQVGQLADLAGVTPRTLQRMFATHAGVSPTWVLRRYRLLEAAEQARLEAVGWAELAVELGYSDQAHLVRDFRSHLGVTPGELVRLAS